MSTIGNARLRKAVLPTVLLGLSVLTAIGCTSQPSASSVAPLPAATPDARDLVRRRMELCRYHPEICVQRGNDNDRPEANQPGPPGRSD